MKVVITSLSARFYLSDGWTEELLKQYSKHPPEFMTYSMGTTPNGYYIFKLGSQVDIEKLYKDGLVTELLGKEHYGELKRLSDLDILKERLN